MQVLEGQITWFVYMIGAIIKGRLTTGSTDAQELLDGELATRALSLLDVADLDYNQQRYTEESRQRLDVALLTFFQHFRKVYVGEVVMHSSKVYQRLKENVGIENYMSLLNVILTKVAHNLKVPLSVMALVMTRTNIACYIHATYMLHEHFFLPCPLFGIGVHTSGILESVCL
jgi:exportin-7